MKKIINKIVIWKKTENAKAYVQLMIDIVQYGLMMNAAVTILSKGWFPFNVFTILGWGCAAHFIYEYPKYWVEEILIRKS